jgi:hypothetical protein
VIRQILGGVQKSIDSEVELAARAWQVSTEVKLLSEGQVMVGSIKPGVCFSRAGLVGLNRRRDADFGDYSWIRWFWPCCERRYRSHANDKGREQDEPNHSGARFRHRLNKQWLYP